MPPCTDDVISGDNLDLGVAIFSRCVIGRLGYYVVNVIRGLCGGGHPERLDWNQSFLFCGPALPTLLVLFLGFFPSSISGDRFVV